MNKNKVTFLPQEEKFIEHVWTAFEDCGLEPKQLMSIVVEQLFAMMLNPDFASMFLSLQVRKKARDSLQSYVHATEIVGQKAVEKLEQDLKYNRFDTPELINIGKQFGQTAKFLQDIVEKADTDANSLAMTHNAERAKVSEDFQELPDRGKSWVFWGLGVLVRIAKELNLSVEEDAVAREDERGTIAFNARRKAIERVGLPEVRQYRQMQCDVEEAEWRNELRAARQVVPEIRPLLLMRIIHGGDS